MTRAETIARKLQAMWPDPATRERVVAALNTYGRESHEGESERVWLGILRLCDARLDRVADLVEVAKHDYRDILFTAETPGEATTPYAVRKDPSPEGRRRLEELQQADRQQYEDWLKE